MTYMDPSSLRTSSDMAITVSFLNIVVVRTTVGVVAIIWILI
jgi:hypothetical protein